jgi:hypothetical protein
MSVREHLEASFIEEPVPVNVEARQPSSVVRRSYFVRDGVVKLQ